LSFHAEGSAETTFSAGSSDSTLQDFVLNLINDEAAKAAYLADPNAALGAAGLSDLDVLDVQEVLPLIADSLPGGLPTDLAALPMDVPALDSLPVAVPEVGDLTGALPVSVPELGDLTGGLPVGVPELGDLTGALPAVGDLAGGLPVGVPELGDLTGALPVAVPELGDLTGGLPALDDLTGALPAVDGLAGGLPAVPALDDLTGALPAVDGLTGALPAVDGLAGALPVAVPELGDLTGGLPAVPALDDLTGALPAVDGLAGGLPAVPALDDLTGALPAVDGLAGGLPAVPALGDLTGGLPAVPALDDLTGALPVAVPELGDLTGGLGGLPVELPSLPTIDTPVGDVTAVVDSVSGLAGVDLDTDALSSTTAGLLSNSGEGGAPTLSSHTETVLGDVAAGAKLAPEEFGGSVAGTTPLADFGGGVVGHVGGDLGAWGGADTVLGDVAVGALAGQDGLALAAESPVANVALNSSGDFSIEPGNLNDVLDVDNIGDTGDAVVGTVAHVVSTGTDTVAGGVDTASDALGGYLTGSTGPVGDTLDDLSGTVTDGITGAGDMVSEHLSNLPTTDALPLDQLPELPQLPDLPEVNSSDLPQVSDVTSHVPVNLPAVDLPDTGAVTDLVTSPVNDIAGATPLGGTVEDVTGSLSNTLGNLDLGL
jgi:hypothetical protein